MTLSKDQPPRKRDKLEARYPWLVPLAVILASISLGAGIFFAIINGVRFF